MAKKWNALLNEALAGIYPAFEAMTDNELRNVRSAKKKATNCNCWWLAYAFAQTLAEIADGILAMRYTKRRKENRALKTPNA